MTSLTHVTTFLADHHWGWGWGWWWSPLWILPWLVFAGVAATGFIGLWHVYPLILRLRSDAARADHSEIPKGLRL